MSRFHTHRRQVAARLALPLWCCLVLFPSCFVKHGLSDAPLLIEHRFQVTRVAHSTLQLRSRSQLSLPSSALPRFLAPSLPPSSALPRFLLPSLPHFLSHASLPLCFPSSPSILHLSSVPAVRAELQNKQLVGRFYLIEKIPTPLVHWVCRPQPRKSSYEESPERLFSLDLCIERLKSSKCFIK